MRSPLIPGRPVPDLAVPLVGGGAWRLAEEKPPFVTLIDFYRGRHCPRCQRHLLDLAAKLPRFAERGVACIAISMDDRERAEESAEVWGLGDLRVGYGLTLEDASAWGLYLSTPIGTKEPGWPFNEPAMMLITPDQRLYSAVYGTTPFNRPHFADVLESLDLVRARDYPPRGDFVPD